MKTVLINGALGRMGKSLEKVIKESKGKIDLIKVDQSRTNNCFTFADQINFEKSDLIIDFSTPQGTLSVVEFCKQNRLPAVIGTTGLSQSTEQQIEELAKVVPVVYASNYSIGINLLHQLVSLSARILDQSFHPEIMEIHHQEKKDAPSGTALSLAETVRVARQWRDTAIIRDRSSDYKSRERQQVGVQSLRGGSVAGEHTVFFLGQNERLELTHRAKDRIIFAQGAWKAAKWLSGKECGLYDMQDVLGFSRI
ncbi:MAG: 4-hydroxy-tetrahydrodipicolinate reductase [Deltaproteobacteria bacterium]|nr:4-hydroxy-tetrahydrodipicolinate reductase [Deltaproteobacteria bacterium]